MKNVLYDRYIKLLSRWIPFSRKNFYYIPDSDGLACYGTGYDEWAVQTNQKAFSAYAALASDPNMDEKAAGMTREALLSDALAMFRYAMRTHKCGDTLLMDNYRWGHTWLSGVGTERMMHGVDCIWDKLTEDDHRLLRNVLISESNWLLDNYPVTAGKVVNNHPESNLWNGAILNRTALYYPDCPRASEYREKAMKFWGSAISVDYDSSSAQMYDGKRLSELYSGDNMFRSFALDHHHYMNVGYIIISLSQIAMMHYGYKARHLETPEILFRHVKDIWQLVRLSTFPDGRLLRAGGDNRVRYCYCQDYCVPSWIFMGDKFGDSECAGWEMQWLDKMETEMNANGDGSFLSARCGQLNRISPLYYTRLEADRACACSYGIYWHRLIGKDSVIPSLPMKAAEGEWQDDYHGTLLVKSQKRTASFVWLGGELPTAICMPTDRSDMAEWRENLCGTIRGFGAENFQELVTHKDRYFAGGFVTSGVTAVCSDEFAAEDQHKEILSYKDTACAALPDDQTMIVIQKADANMRCYIKELKGLYLNVPNDIFNGCRRTYTFSGSQKELEGAADTEEALSTDSKWINIDGCLGINLIYGADSLTIYRPGKRQIGIRKCVSNCCFGSGDIGMLYCDEICAPFKIGEFTADRGQNLIDIGFAVRSCADADLTASYCRSGKSSGIDFGSCKNFRGLVTEGADGVRYALIANFGEDFEETSFTIPGTDIKLSAGLQGKTAELLSEKNGWKPL